MEYADLSHEEKVVYKIEKSIAITEEKILQMNLTLKQVTIFIGNQRPSTREVDSMFKVLEAASKKHVARVERDFHKKYFA